MFRTQLQKMKIVSLHSLYRRVCYKRFLTGLTFKDVRLMLCREADKLRENENEYMFITRHTVLGRWHQIKQDMFRTYHPEFFNNHISLPTKKEIIDIILRKEIPQYAEISDESDFIF